MKPQPPAPTQTQPARTGSFKTTALFLGLALGSSALAQTSLDLPGAVARALSGGPDLSTARANLAKAGADLKARQNDPGAVITELQPVQQAYASASLALSAAKLSVTQTVLSQYSALWEAQQTVSLNSAQAALDEKNLKVAQLRLANQSGTQLDVNKAQNSLAGDRQDLANARAQLPVLEAQLARTLGLPAGSALRIAAPPAPPRLKSTLTVLQGGLEARLTDVLRAGQAVESALLQMKLSDNDYTPRRSLEDARTAAANAQRDLDSARKSGQTALRDAYRAAQDAQERVTLAAQGLATTRSTLAQTQARFKNGTAAALDVQSAQLNVQSAQLRLTQAQDGLWKALAALGVAAGQDLTGLAGGGK